MRGGEGSPALLLLLRGVTSAATPPSSCAAVPAASTSTPAAACTAGCLLPAALTDSWLLLSPVTPPLAVLALLSAGEAASWASRLRFPEQIAGGSGTAQLPAAPAVLPRLAADRFRRGTGGRPCRLRGRGAWPASAAVLPSDGTGAAPVVAATEGTGAACSGGEAAAGMCGTTVLRLPMPRKRRGVGSACAMPDRPGL